MSFLFLSVYLGDGFPQRLNVFAVFYMPSFFFFWLLSSPRNYALKKIGFIYFILAALGIHCGPWASPAVRVVLSCPEACGILVLGPGIKSTSPALAGGFLTTGPLGKSPGMEFSLEITGLYLLEIQPVLM